MSEVQENSLETSQYSKSYENLNNIYSIDSNELNAIKGPSETNSDPEEKKDSLTSYEDFRKEINYDGLTYMQQKTVRRREDKNEILRKFSKDGRSGFTQEDKKYILEDFAPSKDITKEENFTEEEKKCYEKYLEDYQYLRNYVNDPEFKNTFIKSSGLTQEQANEALKGVMEYFKHEKPANTIKLSFSGKNLFYGQPKLIGPYGHVDINKDYFYVGAHELTHLFLSELVKYYKIKPSNSLALDKDGYMMMEIEYYPRIMQIRISEKMKPGQKITLEDAIKLKQKYKDTDSEYFLKNNTPEEIMEVMNTRA